MKKKEEDGELRHYRCPWSNCYHEFNKIVLESHSEKGKYGRKHNYSSIIVCPQCGNRIKTQQGEIIQ